MEEKSSSDACAEKEKIMAKKNVANLIPIKPHYKTVCIDRLFAK
jgi:hypothetical protein